MTPRDLRRFVSFVRVEESCWEWAGGKTEDGYGVFYLDHKTQRAHRVAYEIFMGPIPQTLTIDHLCRNRGCVNPLHLEAVTIKVNTLRGETLPAANATKTHCIHGHEFTPENTKIDRDGRRACRACQRRRSLTYLYKKRLNAKELAHEGE